MGRPGRLLKPQDRLQSQGKYFPYGEDRYNPNPANPANDREESATYTRDSATGLDYANQRYYSAGLGRFRSPDPYSMQVTPSFMNCCIAISADLRRSSTPVHQTQTSSESSLLMVLLTSEAQML